MEKEQRELLAQQQETRRKMAALINAASTGKLKATETPIYQPITAPPEASNQPETTEKVRGPHISGNNAQGFSQMLALFINASHWKQPDKSYF